MTRRRIMVRKLPLDSVPMNTEAGRSVLATGGNCRHAWFMAGDALNRGCGAANDTSRAARVCTFAPVRGGNQMLKFLLWLLLFALCWPLAILAILLWPLIWLVTLPFRLLGIVLEGVFAFLRSLVMLPARVLGGGPGRP